MFKADPKMIKEQIEVLIRDEYMKRDENDRAMLIYLPWELYYIIGSRAYILIYISLHKLLHILRY